RATRGCLFQNSMKAAVQIYRVQGPSHSSVPPADNLARPEAKGVTYPPSGSLRGTREPHAPDKTLRFRRDEQWWFLRRYQDRMFESVEIRPGRTSHKLHRPRSTLHRCLEK